MFLLESTWLALSIWLSEHGALLGAVALAAVQRRPARLGCAPGDRLPLASISASRQ